MEGHNSKRIDFRPKKSFEIQIDSTLIADMSIEPTHWFVIKINRCEFFDFNSFLFFWTILKDRINYRFNSPENFKFKKAECFWF